MLNVRSLRYWFSLLLSLILTDNVQYQQLTIDYTLVKVYILLRFVQCPVAIICTKQLIRVLLHIKEQNTHAVMNLFDELFLPNNQQNVTYGAAYCLNYLTRNGLFYKYLEYLHDQVIIQQKFRQIIYSDFIFLFSKNKMTYNRCSWVVFSHCQCQTFTLGNTI